MKLKYSLILLASAAFASCQDFLDRYPLEEPASSEFYSNEDELTLAVNGAYRSLYWLSNDDVPYQLFIDGATEQPHDGSYTIDDIQYTNERCASLYEYCNEEGTIDLYSIREIDPTATEGCHGLGEMTGIGVYDPATFDQRSFVYWTDLEN